MHVYFFFHFSLFAYQVHIPTYKYQLYIYSVSIKAFSSLTSNNLIKLKYPFLLIIKGIQSPLFHPNPIYFYCCLLISNAMRLSLISKGSIWLGFRKIELPTGDRYNIKYEWGLCGIQMLYSNLKEFYQKWLYANGIMYIHTYFWQFLKVLFFHFFVQF